MKSTSLKLRFWAYFFLFFSAYSPLMVVLVIRDIDFNKPMCFGSPLISFFLVVFAIISVVMTLKIVSSINSGLPVLVTKVSNKSSDMFGYTVPYVISFMKVDLSDWRLLLGVLVLLSVLFVISYRSQAAFVNPVLAVSGYFLLDCAFKSSGKEFQGMVVTKLPVMPGDTVNLEILSQYLYVRTGSIKIEGK